MMAKRGLELIAVHFASPPYTSERARSMPMAGRSTGRVVTQSVTPRAWMVWLATWPTLSPVISPWHPSRRAMASATRIMARRSSYMVYLKSGNAITEFLAFTGAHQAALSMEEERVVKSVRNDVNRK